MYHNTYTGNGMKESTLPVFAPPHTHTHFVWKCRVDELKQVVIHLHL